MHKVLLGQGREDQRDSKKKDYSYGGGSKTPERGFRDGCETNGEYKLSKRGV